MSKSMRIILSFCAVAYLAACGGTKSDEVVYTDAPMVAAEPVFHGKYGN